MASNAVLHEHSKHIEIDSHIAKDKVLEGVIEILPIE